MLLRLTDEDTELFDLLERLTIDLFAGKLVEALFESVQGVGLGRSLLDKAYHLAIQLRLEYSWVHEELNCIRVKQVWTVS